MESCKSPKPASGSHASTLLLAVVIILQAVYAQALWGMNWSQFQWTRENEDKMEIRDYANVELDAQTTGDVAMTPIDINSLEILSNKLKDRPSMLEASEETCWQSAYSKMKLNCRDILDFGELQSKLSLMLTDCFLEILGRDGLNLPSCGPLEGLEGEQMGKCLQSLDNHTQRIFLAFFIDINFECHFLESEELKLDAQKAIYTLDESTHTGNPILKLINHELGKHREKMFKLTDQIADGQKDLQERRSRLKASIDEGLRRAGTHTKKITEGLSEMQSSQTKMQSSQTKMHREYEEFTHTMALGLQELKSDVDEMLLVVGKLHGPIQGAGEVVEEKQNKLTNGLRNLSRLLEERKVLNDATFRKLNESLQTEYPEILIWKMNVDSMQHRLLELSNVIANANEEILHQQANIQSKFMYVVDGLTSMQMDWLMSTTVLKTIFMYLLIYAAIYITTIPPRTQSARLLLTFGFLVSFTSELYLMYFELRRELEIGSGKTSGKQQRGKKIPSWLFVRYTFYVFGGGILLYSYFSFRDYNALNNKMLRQVHVNQFKVDKSLGTMSKDLKEVRQRMTAMNTLNREMMLEILELRKSSARANCHPVLGNSRRRPPRPYGSSTRDPDRKRFPRVVSSGAARSTTTAPF